MEPLSALSLAGNVLQFIEFTIKLLSSSVEIYKSSIGAPDCQAELEGIYQHLSSFSDSFVAAQGSTQSSASELALRKIAGSCSVDCTRLLEVLNSVKVDGDHRAWKSFRAALKLAWKGEQEIERLTTRLRDRQSMMTLHICAISNGWLQDINKHLRDLEKKSTDLQLRHANKLEEISSSLEEIRMQINEPMNSKPSFTFSSTEICTLVNKVSRLSLTERDIVKEQEFLDSLDYHSRETRHEGIPEAHRDTFSWIFEAYDKNEAYDEEETTNNFMKWLRESAGIFWITGKPGSGKSTFMKYVAGHAKTMEAVEQWAAPGRAVIASHFFWNPGISIQKSMEGLLRSLLYEIFRQCPELIAEVCPSRWECRSSHLGKEKWAFKELVSCFQAIKASSNPLVKFCFFIDGLDECDGDYTDISQSLLEIAECPRIKLCVASRPLNEFQDRFGAEEASILRIHELTRDDIIDYTQSCLEEHPRWIVLGLDTRGAELFLKDIADFSCGVFLWVTLVVQSLRRGLTNDDTMDDLNARLHALPRDLEAFYKYMLDSVEPVYRRKSANLLQMQLVLQHTDPQHMLRKMPWAVALLHEREYSDSDYAITMPWKALAPTDVQSLHEKAYRRLNAKCCCILEICEESLEFVHRTASDYLKTREMADYLQANSGEGFNAHFSMLKAWVACLKMGVMGSVDRHEMVPEAILYTLNSDIFVAIIHLAEAARTNGAGDDEVFKQIDCLGDISTPIIHPKGEFCVSQWSTPIGTLYDPRRSSSIFKKCLLEMNAFHYATMKLSENAQYFREVSQWALRLMMGSKWGSRRSPYQPQAEFLHLLLRNGYDLNEMGSDQDGMVGYLLVTSPSLWGNVYRSECWDTSPRFDLDYPELRPQETPRSAWLDYLIECGICGHFSPRRRLESYLHSYCNIPRWSINWHAFNVALHDGIYSLLLHHGADPNAHSTPLTTAWTDFVRIGIKYPSRVTASRSYLETLDDFFKHGVDLGVLTVGLTLRPGDTSSHLPLCMITGWSAFCEALEDLAGSETEKELDFISEITLKMIQQAMRIRWPLGRLPSIIKGAFPEALYEPMLDMISGSRVSGDDSKTRGKRPPEEDNDIEGNGKRLKICPADVVMS